MSATDETTVDAASLRALQDRTDIADVLYRYSSSVDSFDNEGVRSTLADDIWAQYGNGEPVQGGDKLVAWIAGGDRDRRSGSTTSSTSTTSRSTAIRPRRSPTSPPTRSSRRTPTPRSSWSPATTTSFGAPPDGWKISKRVMELLWGESKADEGYLAGLGGRGPKIWQRS